MVLVQISWGEVFSFLIVEVWRACSCKAFIARQGVWFSGSLDIIFSWFYWGAKLFELLLSLAVLSPNEQFSLMRQGAFSKHTRLSSNSLSLVGLRWGFVIWMSFWNDWMFLPAVKCSGTEVVQCTSLAMVFFKL